MRVNWGKSILYPVDDLVEGLISWRSKLLVVDQFKYLGIVIHNDTLRFAELNLSTNNGAFSTKTQGVVRITSNPDWSHQYL